MVISIKSHQTSLRGAYVAEMCDYVDCEGGEVSFWVIRVWEHESMRLD